MSNYFYSNLNSVKLLLSNVIYINTIEIFEIYVGSYKWFGSIVACRGQLNQFIYIKNIIMVIILLVCVLK